MTTYEPDEKALAMLAEELKSQERYPPTVAAARVIWDLSRTSDMPTFDQLLASGGAPLSIVLRTARLAVHEYIKVKLVVQDDDSWKRQSVELAS